jgi:hypothetical protein
LWKQFEEQMTLFWEEKCPREKVKWKDVIWTQRWTKDSEEPEDDVDVCVFRVRKVEVRIGHPYERTLRPELTAGREWSQFPPGTQE